MIRVSVSVGGNRVSDYDLLNVQLDQKMNDHNAFAVSFRQAPDGPSFENMSADWLGKEITIGIGGEEEVDIADAPINDVFKGIIDEMSVHDGATGMHTLIVSGHSPTIKLATREKTRSFYASKLSEIVDRVFNDTGMSISGGIQVDSNIAGDMIESCTQYNESDFDFIKRLANKYGAWFFYDGLKLFFIKKPESSDVVLDYGVQLKEVSLALKLLPYRKDVNSVDHLTLDQMSKNLAAPTLDGKFKSATESVFGDSTSSHFNPSMADSELVRIKGRVHDMDLAETHILSAVCIDEVLTLGAQILVRHHSGGRVNNSKYIVVDVSHNIAQGGEYTCRFKAIASDKNAPPVNGPIQAPICESQVAEVIDTQDPENKGRIKVKLPWNDGSEDSPFVRVCTPYAGDGYGFHFLPEIGDYVLLGFENGDADFPYVLSALRKDAAAPFDPALSGDNYLKGYITNMQNKIVINDDLLDILLESGKTINIQINDEAHLISIDGESKEITIKGESINLEGKNITLKAEQNIKLEASQNLEAKASQNVTIEGMQISANASTKNEVKGATVDVSGSAMVNVKGGLINLN